MCRLPRHGSEDQAEVDHGVPCHGEREFRLALAGPLRAGHDQCAGVEDRRQGRQPRFVVVLGAEVGEDRYLMATLRYPLYE